MKIPLSIIIGGAISLLILIVTLIIAIAENIYGLIAYGIAISTLPIGVVLIYEIRKGNIRTREERKRNEEAEYQEQLIQTDYTEKQRSSEEIRSSFSKENLEKIDALRIRKEKEKKYKCSIGKILILQGQDVLQCPKCKSNFSAINLMIWLEKKKNCPVCKLKLIE